jgi:phage FluMu protein Com
MTRHSVITKGRGFIFPGESGSQGLRCKAEITVTRHNRETGAKEERIESCNRLIAKPNRDGELAGEFSCPKCKQILEVKLNANESAERV